MDKFYIVINETSLNSWAAVMWEDIKDRAMIFYDNNRLKSGILKKLKKFHFSNKANRKFWIPLKSIWNSCHCIGYTDLQKTERNFIIFQSGIKFSPSFISRLKRDYNARIILYLPDTLEKLGLAKSINEFERYKKYYQIDSTYSFDPEDCKIYGMNFFDMFSSETLRALQNQKKTIRPN